MAINALDYAKEDWYVCEDDPGARPTLQESKEAGATIFYFRPISSAVITEIQDSEQLTTIRALNEMNNSGMEQVVTQRTNRRNRQCFRHAVRRIENFHKPNGDRVDVIFDRVMVADELCEIVSSETLNHIHSSVIGEVGKEIYTRFTMDENKRKKLEAALSGLGGSPSGTADNVADKTNTNEDVSETQDPET